MRNIVGQGSGSVSAHSQLLIDGRFVAVFPRLVKALNGDLTAAAVLQAIHYRSQINDDPDGWMLLSLTTIAEEIGISRPQARRTTAKLVALGLLSQDDRNGSTRRWRVEYDAIQAVSEGGTKSYRSNEAVRIRTATDTNPYQHRYESVPDTSYIEVKEVKKGAKTAPEPNMLAQQIAKAYTDRVPLSKFVAIMGIVKKALKAGYAPERIEAALIDLAEEGRPVTIDTLRIQLDGIAPLRAERKSGAQMYDGLLDQIGDQPVAAIGSRP